MRTTRIQHQDQSIEIRIFPNPTLLQRHVFKHFLSHLEAWSDVDGVRMKDDERAAWRQRIEQTGCAGEVHNYGACTRFHDCSHALDTVTPDYLTTIEQGIRDVTTPGQELYIEIADDKGTVLMLSPYGIQIRIGRIGSKWTVHTAFMRRLKGGYISDCKPLDHFVDTVDSIYRKIRVKKLIPRAVHTHERWQALFSSLDACSR